VDVTTSAWDSTLEAQPAQARFPAVRLGLRQIKGFPESTARRLCDARGEAAFRDLDDLLQRVRLRKDELESLAEAGALETLVRGRRQALWRARAPRVGGLFASARFSEPEVELPPLRGAEQLLLDYQQKNLSVNDHPLRHLRAGLERRGVVTAEALVTVPHGKLVNVAGVVLCRQQPATASGVVFMTLEDETGFLNLVLFRDVFERFLWPARHAALLFAHGALERAPRAPGLPAAAGEAPDSGTNVTHVVVRSLERLDVPGRDIASVSRDFR
jgi:error-prone DNA polymerase